MMPGDAGAWAGYGAAWLIFGTLHSLTADARIKTRLVPFLGGAYRIVYNVFALLSIALVFWLGYRLFSDTSGFAHGGGTKVLLGGMQIAGWFLLFIAFRPYNSGLLIGTTQLRRHVQQGDVDGDEALHTDGLHRYVRHPLYSAAFLILWGAVWTPFGLATAIFGSAYLLIGTYLEEKRLLARYGSDYARYKARVPAFIPWRGRVEL